jgi:hypothetical protein
MPSSRHHTEWLSLIEVSGPFLSVPVLERVFPQGLHDKKVVTASTGENTDEIMVAFRKAARNRGWLERDELLKEVSNVLGYQRIGPKIDEALRGHLRAAIRRRIIDTDGPSLVRAGAVSMADYEPDELLEVFRSVMRKGTSYDREEVIPALARHLGFVRLTDSIREPIRKAITRAIRQGILGYEGNVIWREQ